MAQTDKRYIDAALYGLSYLLKHIAPSVSMGDRSDIETDVALIEVQSNEWKSALYLFDTVEGGVGYAEKVYELLDTVLKLCQQILQECECDSGCPSCVPPLPPGVNNEELEALFIESNASVECSLSLLHWLIEGQLILPNVQIRKQVISSVIQPPPEDPEKVKLNQRLQKASKILRRKRERLH